jgi:glycosyltransferase involved in cell wall biosynthesis
VSEPISVSVIVPFLDAERTLGALISGLRSQHAVSLGATEFVFVDNGSTDGGRAIVEASGLPHLRVADQSVRGVSAVRNKGLELARGEVLAVIDSDCVPARGWLRELVAPFNSRDVHLAAGSLASFPPRTGAQRFAARYGLNDARRPLDMAVPFANGRNMAVRRASAEQVGGWPGEMLQGEDIEFSHRVRSRFDCSIEFRERALVYHQDRETDDELWRQAHGYGRGIAMLYDRHPDELPWGAAQRMRRVRMSSRRRIGAAAATVGSRLGRVSADDAEFARYLAGWDAHFWRGFYDERRRRTRGAPA